MRFSRRNNKKKLIPMAASAKRRATKKKLLCFALLAIVFTVLAKHVRTHDHRARAEAAERQQQQQQQQQQGRDGARKAVKEEEFGLDASVLKKEQLVGEVEEEAS